MVNRLLNFKMSGRLIFGIGAVHELPAVVQRLGAKKPLVVTDPGLVQAGIAGRVMTLVPGAALFDRVEPDPRFEVVDDCLTAARAAGADLVIGLGGGSSLDIAKVTAVLLTNAGPVASLVGIDQVPQPGVVTVMIPTTAGTGSEVTPIAVLSDKAEHLKKGIVSDHLYASVALVDPELTVGLPAPVTAATGVDALAHALEAYTNKFAQPFVDTFALEAIRLVGASLRQAVQHGADRPARSNMALASLYGGMCLGPVSTAGTHALAYPLGGTYNIPHGVAIAVLLPHVMEYNLTGNPEKYARIAEALGETRAAARAPVAVKKLAADIGIVTRLRDLNIPAAAIEAMAAAAMKVTRLLNNNPRPLTVAGAREIYRNAW